MKRAFLASLSVMALTIGATPVAAKSGELPDQLELGRNGAGNPCVATPFWKGDAFKGSYTFTCRGASANRYLGIVRSVRNADIAAVNSLLDCAPGMAVTLPGIGSATARRCFDKLLGQETIETRFARDGRIYTSSAVPLAQGPAEEALRFISGVAAPNQDRTRSTTAAVEVGVLAPSPAAAGSAAGAVANAEDALQQGLRLVRQGLHLDAARIVSDALARLPADAAPATKIDLLLLAGLADSNLRFFDSAEDYFSRANTLLAQAASIPGADVLQLKSRNYGAMHLINKREFSVAVTALEQGSAVAASAEQPLLDAVKVRALNETAKGGAAGSALARAWDNRARTQLVIDAQAGWARSVALLGQNRPAEAQAAIDMADSSIAALRQEPIPQQQLLWLAARIERQRARLQLRNDDRQGALVSLDKAIGFLRLAEDAGDNGPALAQVQLERAAVLSRGGGSTEEVLAQFDDAVSSLISADADVGGLPAQTRSYLDELVNDAARRPDGSSPERFFRALQAAATPAIARQFVELQSLIAADPVLAAKVQDRQEVEREINKLRFEIASGTDAAKRAELEARRAELENRSLALQNELTANGSFRQVIDTPASIGDVRSVLKPGEGYLKLSKVGGYVFGALIDASGTRIYRVARPAVEIDPLVKAVRQTITGDGDKVPVFSVSGANALYKLLMGPAADRINGYTSLVIDGSGVLDTLPVGILVTDAVSTAAFAKSRRKDAYDYTGVSFLARKMALSTALSPRSLIVLRNLAPSKAPQPFIGFAQHQPVAMDAKIGGMMVSIGANCEVELQRVAEMSRMLEPIDASELRDASAALGVPQAPSVTGSQFTDTGVRSRIDLDQFQVLHFATHGLTEGQWGCSKAPPALVTSVGEANSDGILSFDEVAQLRLDANLVVLSACDTSAGVSATASRATGQEQVGGSLDGLVRAFLAARAQAVLSTYWPISDAGESVQLITSFYSNARTGTIGDALQKAQVSLMTNRTSSHPIYWGAFVLVGDSQKSLLNGAARIAVENATTSKTEVAQLAPVTAGSR
ncbi:CHAT domain-containing protein [Novosphingobium sp.]|uniref:CHAT domain-containing protein n=1 Tax=Novosphingobium sp. TaxID=1874826 RepID=UPI003569DABC